jgi:glycosyltransferase involved in cell wall biosynthesis
MVYRGLPLEDASGPRILCFATQGHSHLEGQRVRELLALLSPEVYPFEHDRKVRSALGLLKAVRRRRPDLVVMEGTGVAGGLALMFLDAALGVPFIVSSGDAVAPYLALRSRLAGRLGGVYERALCRRCAGFVGWTPYLVGRALTYGAPRAMTAPGWSRGRPSDGARESIRARLGIAPEAIVVGLVGSLNWRARVGYAYGAELVLAMRRVTRPDVVVCIVGDGSGLQRLQTMAAEELGSRILLPGRVEREEVVDYLAAFDIASLPQSVDGVGSFRYTTKLSEYRDAGLPIITGQIPAAYDLDAGFLWRLAGSAPWSPTYVAALVELLQSLNADEIAGHRQAILAWREHPFDKLAQQRRTRDFVLDTLERVKPTRAKPI